MKRQVLGTTTAFAVFAALLLGGPVFSDEQLRAQVSDQLKQHGIEIANFDKLSDTQILQINLLMGSTENVSAHGSAIEALLAEKLPCDGNDQLRASVASQLKQHGIAVPNFETISGSELVVVAAVVNSNEKPAEMKAQIERIFAAETPLKGNDQLRAEVKNCLLQLDVNLENIDSLTPDQLVQIELISSGSGSEDEKRMQIEGLANE